MRRDRTLAVLIPMGANQPLSAGTAAPRDHLHPRPYHGDARH